MTEHLMQERPRDRSGILSRKDTTKSVANRGAYEERKVWKVMNQHADLAACTLQTRMRVERTSSITIL